MQAAYRKFQNINNEQLKSIYKDTNFIISQKIQKYLYREQSSSRFISKLKNIRKPET